jgi:hypothetical protein
MRQQRNWQIRRTGVPMANAQQRWDRAYQLLLQWVATDRISAETPTIPIQPEMSHARSDLQPRFDQPSGRAPDH